MLNQDLSFHPGKRNNLNLDYLKGKWIAIEGVDAVGKTTQLARLSSELSNAGIQTKIIPEFSNSPVGHAIQSIVEKNRFYSLHEKRITPIADILTIISDLVYSLECNPKSKEGTLLSDRGVLSIISYQGYRLFKYSNMPLDSAISYAVDLTKLAFEKLYLPDVSILFTARTDTISMRVVQRGESVLSNEEVRFIEISQSIFKELANYFPVISIPIDNISIPEVSREVLNKVKLVLK